MNILIVKVSFNGHERLALWATKHVLSKASVHGWPPTE